MTLLATTLDTPTAPLTLIAAGDALVASGFTQDVAALADRLAPRLRDDDVRLVPDLGGLSKAHAAYLDGDLAALDDVEIDLGGTPGQQRLWQALRAVQPGTTVTYAQLAQRGGNAAAVRAAGSACARNLIAPVVPCHRVVRSDGKLGGYYYGLRVKEWLLEHERRALA